MISSLLGNCTGSRGVEEEEEQEAVVWQSVEYSMRHTIPQIFKVLATQLCGGQVFVALPFVDPQLSKGARVYLVGMEITSPKVILCGVGLCDVSRCFVRVASYV